MADSLGMHSYGTKLFRSSFAAANPAGVDPVGVGYVLVAEVISINGVPMNPSVTKLTNLTSPGKAHEKVPGITDAGQITLRLNNYPLLYSTLTAIMPDDADAAPGWGRYQWVVQFPNGGQWYATAFLQGSPFEVPEDDRITVEVTLEISGRPVFTAG